MMQVAFTDGTVVTLSDRFTHRAGRELVTAMNPDLDGKVDVKNVIKGIEAVLPLLITQIEQPDRSETVPFSQEWLDDLLEQDYEQLQAAVLELKNRGTEAGKKNSR